MIDDEISNYVDDAGEEDLHESEHIHREDKIFNNRYNVGEALVEGEEQSYSSKITVAPDYADSYLKDLYDYEANLELKAIIDELFVFIRQDLELSLLLQRCESKQNALGSVAKVKLSKDEVNFFFNRINTKFELSPDVAIFYSPIYILEVLSSISSIEYKKLFDMLDTEFQEILLLDLNKRYRFLDGKMNKKRIH